MNTTLLESKLNINELRDEFPCLHQELNGSPLAYFDNAASTQKPRQVLDAILSYYEYDNANVHRGVHGLSRRTTFEYESARQNIARFINAFESRELIFVRGTTEAINLVTNCYAANILKPGDEVITTYTEHHSNLIPWQEVCRNTGAKLLLVPIDENGVLDMDVYKQQLSERTKMVAVCHTSNATGNINDIKAMTTLGHQYGARVLIDGAQAMAHSDIDVQELDCDFFCFSGHKMYGPSGIGVLYGKENLLDSMPPYMYGGKMVKSATAHSSIYHSLPFKFEAGTPNIVGAIALSKACDFIDGLGRKNINDHEQVLLNHATTGLQDIPGVQLIGAKQHRAVIISFVIDQCHDYDVGVALDDAGIAIRTGDHCCNPLMKSLNLTGTIRASLGVYNTKEEVDRLLLEVRRIAHRRRA